MKNNMQIKTSSILALFIFGISIAISISGTSKSMAEAASVNPPSSSAPAPSSAVYIVYTEKPVDEAEPESFHLNTLSSVLGSEAAAKDSLIYVYKNAATGFSAKLTPEQVSQLEKQPGVLQVVPSRNLQLHSGGGKMNMMT